MVRWWWRRRQREQRMWSTRTTIQKTSVLFISALIVILMMCCRIALNWFLPDVKHFYRKRTESGAAQEENIVEPTNEKTTKRIHLVKKKMKNFTKAKPWSEFHIEAPRWMRLSQNEMGNQLRERGRERGRERKKNNKRLISHITKAGSTSRSDGSSSSKNNYDAMEK